jgi:hypothetical protein
MQQMFFAYPDSNLLRPSIEAACQSFDKASGIFMTPWSSLKITGFKLDKLIREKLSQADALFADVTYPNANVYYEIGYALGLQKPVVPTINISIERASENVKLIGIFDTIGQLRYENSEELARKIEDNNFEKWLPEPLSTRNHGAPLFFLDTLSKLEFRNDLVQAISNAKVKYRSFDPTEVPRLSAPNALKEISSSTGVILPLLGDQIADNLKHNLRASFLLGYAHALNIETFLAQWERSPAPVDYTDFVTNLNRKIELDQKVSEFCHTVLIENQKEIGHRGRQSKNPLSDIDLGASAAENEAINLGEYYIETAEYNRAVKSQSSIIIGRKGSGKSAMLFMLAEQFSRVKRNIVCELIPASHNLTELREALLSVSEKGVFDHTIAAFWNHILYCELLMALRERLLPKSKYSSDFQEKIIRIEKAMNLTESMAYGDFTGRLQIAVHQLVEAIKNNGELASFSKLTNLMFEKNLPKLRALIVELRSEFEQLYILFDNIDKGWPAHGVEVHDIRIVRLLIDAMATVQNDLIRDGVQFKYHVFLRSDVYDLLVDETSDRGKYNTIRVDWHDKEQLRHMLKRRISRDLTAPTKLDYWSLIFPEVEGTSSFDEVIGSSLMRPRFLIELVDKTLAIAINRGHTSVSDNDLEEALKLHSNYLVSDFAYEIRDVSGLSEDIFYGFIGTPDLMTIEEVIKAISYSCSDANCQKAFDLLVWYGFIGLAKNSSERLFIFETNYDSKRMKVEIQRAGEDALFCVHPAFMRGLNS